MAVLIPRTLEAALGALAQDPTAHVLAGGTDLMVEVNHGHRRPAAVVAVGRLEELRGWKEEGAAVTIGAATTYTQLLDPSLARLVPGLAQASRTVGSPQIRNAGTIGGNIATASPAGDTLPVLAALGAVVTLRSASAQRDVPLSQLITGPKRTVLAPGELVVSVSVPRAEEGDVHEYLKVGTRNAMVIAVASVALCLRPGPRTVSVAMGSVGPVPVVAAQAGAWVAEQVDWQAMAVSGPVADEFGRQVASAASPIDDHRSTAAYRRRAVEVLAGRALRRALPGSTRRGHERAERDRHPYRCLRAAGQRDRVPGGGGLAGGEPVARAA